MIFREEIAFTVTVKTAMEFLTFLGVIAVTQLVEVCVGIKAVLCNLDLCNGYVAAVVARDATVMLLALFAAYAELF